jgi:hypothetical protein
MAKSNQAKHKSRKVFYIFSLCTVLIIAGAIYLYIHHKDHPKVSIINPTNTIHQLTNKSATNNGQKQSSSSSTVNQGTSVDNNGVVSTPVNNNSSLWTESQSGVITVKDPLQNATIASGASLVGSATASQVQYTLIDNDVGVISLQDDWMYILLTRQLERR